MFLDDDVKFERKSLEIMRNFLNNNKKYSGIGFNRNGYKRYKSNFRKFKRSKIFQLLGVYDYSKGVVTISGWHTKATNLKKDNVVEWLPTQAVIYKYNIIK